MQRIVVYPATSAYLATVTVLGRERLTVPAGTYNAIKLDLQLSKIGKENQLEPHRKFRHANAWISDDPDRLMLRIEAQIFVGTVFAELQSVEFDNAKPSSLPSDRGGTRGLHHGIPANTRSVASLSGDWSRRMVGRRLVSTPRSRPPSP